MQNHEIVIAMLLREFAEQYMALKVGISPEEVPQRPDECKNAIKDIFKRVYARQANTNVAEVTADMSNLAKFVDCLGTLMDEAGNEFLAEKGIKVQ